MTTLKEKQLFESFQDKDYRDIFVEEHIGVGLAHQIRALRDKYGWTQEELSNRAGKKQPVIAQLENPDYGSYTIKTLKTLASAFDVALQVNFVSFRDLIKRAANLTPDIIAPKGYEEERQLSFATRDSSFSWVLSDDGPKVSHAIRSELDMEDPLDAVHMKYAGGTIVAGNEEELIHVA